MLQAAQGANWQRSGGKGAPPRRIERPDDRPPRVRSASELEARKAAQREELARRRRRRQMKGA
ncbi:hypothetical protein C3472_25030 [Mycobacterium kansasii]|nr:hypothetical protein B1T50_04580 [Mycobacterium kansasii]POY12443.1 hypothetical protein C3472_25030 [Mycobacterium kansasii]